jgi:hypothetical protein
LSKLDQAEFNELKNGNMGEQNAVGLDKKAETTFQR